MLQVKDYGAKPTLVSLYAKTAALAFEPVFQTEGEVSYETSLSQVGEKINRLGGREGGSSRFRFLEGVMWCGIHVSQEENG